jgi:4-amino-4-deoxy-L-arabinose transferase-like glycosyltransferase
MNCLSAKQLREPDSYRPFVIVLTAFLAVHFVLSMALSGSFSPDDADQLIFSQTFAAGYYEQPPLYSWLTYLSFKVLGLRYPSYFLVKSISLGLIYVACFCSARLLGLRGWTAVLATFLPLLIPTFAWHSFSYLTNTNLVCAASAISFYAIARLERSNGWIDYGLLGLALGTGLLSKYNFSLVAAALFIAAVTIPSLRRRVLSYRMLIAIVIAAVVALPNLLWLFSHRTALVAILNEKLHGTTVDHQYGRLRGFATLFSNIVLILLPAGIVFAIGRRQLEPFDRLSDIHRLLARFFIVAAGLLILLILLGGATRFHERWLQPFTLLVPLFAFSCYRVRSSGALRGLALIVIVAGIACAGVRTGQIFFGGFDRGVYPLQMDFSAAARELGALAGSGAVVISRDRELAGNLRYQLPTARHLTNSHPLYLPPLDEFKGPRILVWNQRSGSTLPNDLRDFSATTLGLKISEDLPVQFVDVPPRLSGRRSNRLAYVVVPQSNR